MNFTKDCGKRFDTMANVSKNLITKIYIPGSWWLEDFFPKGNCFCTEIASREGDRMRYDHLMVLRVVTYDIIHLLYLQFQCKNNYP